MKFMSRDWGECEIVKEGRYPDGSNPIVIRSVEDNSPIAKLTVNLNTGPLPDGLYLVRAGQENRRIAADILAAGLFVDTGARVPSGYIEGQVWKEKSDESSA